MAKQSLSQHWFKSEAFFSEIIEFFIIYSTQVSRHNIRDPLQANGLSMKKEKLKKFKNLRTLFGRTMLSFYNLPPTGSRLFHSQNKKKRTFKNVHRLESLHVHPIPSEPNPDD